MDFLGSRKGCRWPRLAEQWDADPYALNTPGGAVDLRTGDIQANRPEDYLTKCTWQGDGAR